MSVTATAPGGEARAVCVDGSDTVGTLLVRVREALGLQLEAAAYEVFATSGAGHESALHHEPEGSHLAEYGILGVGEAVDVRVVAKYEARLALARQGINEANAVQRLAEGLRERGDGVGEAMAHVVAADWERRAPDHVGDDDEDEDDDDEAYDLITLAVRGSGVRELDMSGCHNMTTLPDGFLSCCSALVSVRLPPNVMTIGADLLSACSSLTTVDLSPLSNITSVGDGFLSKCSSLTTVDLSPLSNITSVGHCFLWKCSLLTTVDLSPLSNITSVGDGFLSECLSLTTVDLSPLSNITSVGNFFLSKCSSLTTVDLSPLSNITSVGNFFLSKCSSLTTVDLSPLSNITSVGYCFLSECSSLTTIAVPQSPAHCLSARVEQLGVSVVTGSAGTSKGA
eukprot:TRINITY_DN1127_c0_g1_i6.p1 TRINITY_DN1127_c0_g1~~TRINITY_DN1127_c0_g1_i6.p1  ORF type:complete len:397 (+),score=41.05 TRINITY_DN1127_c0_g1_i6:60-1250(+)